MIMNCATGSIRWGCCTVRVSLRHWPHKVPAPKSPHAYVTNTQTLRSFTVCSTPFSSLSYLHIFSIFNSSWNKSCGQNVGTINTGCPFFRVLWAALMWRHGRCWLSIWQCSPRKGHDKLDSVWEGNEYFQSYCMSVRLQFCERYVNVSGYIQNDANLDNNRPRFAGLIIGNNLYRSTLDAWWCIAFTASSRELLKRCSMWNWGVLWDLLGYDAVKIGK
jgi:hypothetical protein